MAGMTAAEIVKELNALPEEVRRASRTARLKAGQKARAETRRQLRGKLDKPKERVKGRRNIIWLGANPVAADHIPGAVAVSDGKVSILGKAAPDAVRFDPQNRTSAGDWESADWITLRREGSRLVGRYMVAFDEEAAAVFDAVADQAAEIFLDEFEKEIRRVTGAS